jgi:uncharacterized protein
MEKLIQEWALHAEEKSDESLYFIKRLKGYDNQNKVDRLAKEAHDYYFSKIDCTKCANCCKTRNPTFSKADVKRIADFKNVKPKEIVGQYLKMDEIEGALTTKTLPCPFLEDNKCSIYDVRPKDCAGYPYTDKKYFTQRSFSHSANSVDCPAVYHILERLKEDFDRSKRRRY